MIRSSLLFVAIALLTTNCSRRGEASVAASEDASAKQAANNTRTAAISAESFGASGILVDSADAGLQRRLDYQHRLEEVFGDRARITGEKAKVVAVVDQWLKDERQYPRPRQFLVDQRGDTWIVNVLPPLERIMHGQQDGGIEVQVARSQGEYRILKGVAR